jgi:hypothetical protein
VMLRRDGRSSMRELNLAVVVVLVRSEGQF